MERIVDEETITAIRPGRKHRTDSGFREIVGMKVLEVVCRLVRDELIQDAGVSYGKRSNHGWPIIYGASQFRTHPRAPSSKSMAEDRQETRTGFHETEKLGNSAAQSKRKGIKTHTYNR